MLHRVRRTPDTKLAICDLSAAPFIDLAGSRMIHRLYDELASHGILLRAVGAHGQLRDMLRADGIGEKIGELDRKTTVGAVIAASAAGVTATAVQSLSN